MLILQGLFATTDTMIAASKNPDPPFLFTLSLFQLCCARYQEQGKYGIPPFVSLNTLHSNLLSPFLIAIA
jgi:uncharacterized protein (DUF2237 family)